MTVPRQPASCERGLNGKDYYQNKKTRMYIETVTQNICTPPMQNQSPGQTSARATFHETSYNICCPLLHVDLFNLFQRGVAKRIQHFVQHDTTFLHAWVQQSTTKLHEVAKLASWVRTSKSLV